MSRKLLYFPISTADQARIDPASIQVESGPPEQPDLLRVRFTVTDPTAGAPRIQPMFAGALGFLPDAGGTLPDDTTAFDYSSAEFATWQTQGCLFVDADTASVRAMQAISGRPPLLPNRMAYWPVQLPEAFVYGTLKTATQLKHAKIHLPAGGSVNVGTTAWQAQAVAGFLNTTYRPSLRTDANDPTRDDLQRFAMPTVVMDAASGDVELWISAACRPAGDFLDDGRSADLAAAASAMGVTALDDVKHPVNGALPVWPMLQALQFEMLDADLFNALADAITFAFPLTPRFFELRLMLMGRPSLDYHCGALTGQEFELKDAAGNLLQRRRIPLHGRVTVLQAPPASAPPVVTLELLAGPLDPQADAAGFTATAARTYRIDFAAPQPLRLTLAPADLTAHGPIIVALQSAPTTRTATRTSLEAWENDIRPAAWPPAGLVVPPSETDRMIFSGSRKPWLQMDPTEINQFLAGVRRVVSNGPAPVPAIRAAEAIVLWIMEGKVSGINYKGFTTTARPWLRFTDEIPGFSAANVAAASATDITALVRVWALWNLWGLDDLNHHTGANDNQPTLSGNLPAAVASHNTAFDAGLARMAAMGLVPPTRADVDAAFEVQKTGAVWKFRISTDHHERLVWLQYTELQRRLIRIAPNLTPASNDVWLCPAFGYMSYNGGMDQRPTYDIDLTKTVYREWTDANARMGVGTCAAADPQQALRCKPITSAEMSMVASTTETKNRRGSSRINGMHFAALFESFALIYPQAK